MTFRAIAKILFFFLFISLINSYAAGAESTQLKIIVGNDVIKGKIESNPITRHLLELTPLSLKMEEYADSEKIAFPPRKLNIRFFDG